MQNTNLYDVLIVGGGISACVFASNYLKANPRKKIALVEIGRGLGGRSSTRKSKRFEGWEINHGSPNLNICNSKKNKLLDDYINELLENKFIKIDDSDVVQLEKDLRFRAIKNSDFSCGNNYLSVFNMSKLSQNIISSNNLGSQIDFYFETFIVDLKFLKDEWNLTSVSGNKFNSRYLVCSSNLLLHKRSLPILNLNEIPLRKAIPQNEDLEIDSLFDFLDQQSFVPRLSFLIYTNDNYTYKDSYYRRNRYFYLNENLENRYSIERVIFQLQKNNKLGIVIHTKSADFIGSYIAGINEELFKQKIISIFNDLFFGSPSINQLTGNENISIMKWRASQPSGVAVPLSLQYCKKFKIGFCGDWFEGEGFGRIEGSILSALTLANKFNN